MAFNYFYLPSTAPFPPDAGQTFVSEWLSLRMKGSTEDTLVRPRNQPPTSPQFRLYRHCLQEVFDSSRLEKEERRVKIAQVLDRLKVEVEEERKKFLDMFKKYNCLVRENMADEENCREKTASGIERFKELVLVGRSVSKANHSLLYLKDGLEEALETYKEAEDFLKTSTKSSCWESAERLFDRYQRLVAVKEGIQKRYVEEREGIQKAVEEMYDIQREAGMKQRLLEARLRHIARQIHLAERERDKLQTKQKEVLSTNEKAWTDYCIINMALFDLIKALQEGGSLDERFPCCEVPDDLGERLGFIRIVHSANKELLRKWGAREREGDERGPEALERRALKMKEQDLKTLARLAEVVDRYNGRILPQNFLRYLAHLRQKNRNFPQPGDAWAYICKLIGRTPHYVPAPSFHPDEEH